MAKITKRLQELTEKIDPEKNYVLSETVDMVKTLASVKFDETVEIVLKLNVDPRHADQTVRDSVVLPTGTGKKVRVVVITKDAKADEAQAAGADIIGSGDLVEEIRKGSMNFDVLVAIPNLMGLAGRAGRILGPKGLTPSPKTGIVTMDVAQAVYNAKSGQVNFRIDKQGNIHAGLGKVSLTKEKLLEDISTFVKVINKHKPAAVKGRYIKNAALSSMISPPVKPEVQELLDMK